jgi:GT2 family glycosyltransferase
MSADQLVAEPRISILIVNYRSYGELTACLESLHRFISDDVEVVIVDHESDASAAAHVMNEFGWVRLLPSSSNSGFAAGVNRGARNAAGAYLLLLNPDCIVVDDVPHVLAAYMQDHLDVGVAGALVRNGDGSIQASARRFPGFMTGVAGRTGFLSRRWPENRWTAANLVRPSLSNQVSIVDWVAGSCMMIRLSAFKAVGGMDERFFMYWEDADLCSRLRAKGWTTVYLPTASVVHLTSRSSAQAPIRSLVAFHRSAYLYFRKNGPRRWQMFAPIVFGLLSLRLIAKIIAGRVLPARELMC